MNDTSKQETQKKNLIYNNSELTVLVVIVNWNGKNDLLECLSSLRKLGYPRDKYKVMVVDNGSTDGSQEAVSKFNPEILLIENKRNRGYVRAVNQGIEFGLRKGVDYIWVFNNDVVIHEDSLQRLTDIGELDESIGIIAPVLYSYDKPQVISHVGYRISFWIGRLKKLKCGVDVFKNPEEKMADVVSVLGCANLIKTSVFKKIGLFRPIYELYFEETDLCVRARQRGFRVVVVREAKVWHKESSTMNRFIFRRAYLLLRNLFLFELFNAKLKHLFIFIPYYFLLHVPYFILRGSIYGIKVKLLQLRKK